MDRNQKNSSIDNGIRDMDFFNSEHNINISRLDMERGKLFNNVSNNNMKRTDMMGETYLDPDNENIGEITGKYIKYDEEEQGMPLRSDNTTEIFGRQERANPHVDFNLFNIKSNPEFKVSYFDPTAVAGNFSTSYATVTDKTTILERLKNHTINDDVNAFSINLLNNFESTNNFCFSPLNLFFALGIMMYASTNDIYYELKTIVPSTEIIGIINFIKMTKKNIYYDNNTDINLFITPLESGVNNNFTTNIKDISNIIAISNKDKHYQLKIIKYLQNKNHNKKDFQFLVNNLNKNKLNNINFIVCNLNIRCSAVEYIYNIPYSIMKQTIQKYAQISGSKLIEIEADKDIFIGFLKGDYYILNELVDKLQEVHFTKLAIPSFIISGQYDFTKKLTTLGLNIFNISDFSNISKKKLVLGSVNQETIFQIQPFPTKKIIKQDGRGGNIIIKPPFLCYIKKGKNYYIFTKINKFN